MLSPDSLYHNVLQQGWAVFPDVVAEPTNTALLALGRRFGATSLQGTRSGAPNLENDGVNRVENMDTPMRDAVGNAVLSSNSEEFPLHTDDSYSPKPARYVLMHCWQADESGGGESWLAHVDQIIALAPPALVDRLATQSYTTPYGSAPVLWRDAKQQWRVRFNRRDMIGFAKLRFQFMNAQKRDDLAAFEQLAMQCKQSVPLRQGDCIVVDNHRVLHGRSAFNPESGRLIKRLRILEAEVA
jgi:alpha-ketoglutarate-dependent taurine dioxygenase